MPVLKPTGAPVPKPEGGYLATAGEPVAMNVYWHRRVLDGSVAEVSPPQAEANPNDHFEDKLEMVEASPDSNSSTPKPAARRRAKKE